MTGTRTCSECGSTDAVEHVADLAPGEPWFVCRPCLDRFAREALVLVRADFALLASAPGRPRSAGCV